MQSVEVASPTLYICYSRSNGTQSDPPFDADCSTSGITGTSTILWPLLRGTTYYIWVAAESAGIQGAYSDRQEERTYVGKQSNIAAYSMYSLHAYVIRQ